MGLDRFHEHNRSPRDSIAEAEDRRYKALPAPRRPNGQGWAEFGQGKAPHEALRPDNFRGRQGGRGQPSLLEQGSGRESNPKPRILEEAGGEPGELG